MPHKSAGPTRVVASKPSTNAIRALGRVHPHPSQRQAATSGVRRRPTTHPPASLSLRAAPAPRAPHPPSAPSARRRPRPAERPSAPRWWRSSAPGPTTTRDAVGACPRNRRHHTATSGARRLGASTLGRAERHRLPSPAASTHWRGGASLRATRAGRPPFFAAPPEPSRTGMRISPRLARPVTVSSALARIDSRHPRVVIHAFPCLRKAAWP